MSYFKKIGITFFSKLLIAVLNLLTLIITARWLGPEVRGQIGMLMVFLASGVIVAEFIAGPILVYWTTRIKNSLLIKYAYTWIVLVSLLMILPLLIYDMVPGLSIMAVFPLMFFLSAHGANSNILLGRGRILFFNLSSVLAPFYLLIVCYLSSGKDEFGFPDYVLHLSISYLLSWIFSSLFLIRTNDYVVPFDDGSFGLKAIIKSGIFNQSSSLFTLAGSRLNLFFLEAASGISAVGIFSSALSFSEALLIVPGSISVVLVSSLVNLSKEEQSKNNIVLHALVSGIITFAGMLVLWMLPGYFFEWLLGKKFEGLNEIFLPLLPGIVSVGAGSVFTHYFSGNGKYLWNALISFCGLLVWIVSAYFFTRGEMAQVGAAYSFSFGWVFVLLLNLLVFYFYNRRALSR